MLKRLASVLRGLLNMKLLQPTQKRLPIEFALKRLRWEIAKSESFMQELQATKRAFYLPAAFLVLVLLFGCPQGKPDSGAAAVAEKICNDGLDNDSDSLADCADPDCAGYAACQTSPLVLNNGTIELKFSETQKGFRLDYIKDIQSGRKVDIANDGLWLFNVRLIGTSEDVPLTQEDLTGGISYTRTGNTLELKWHYGSGADYATITATISLSETNPKFSEWKIDIDDQMHYYILREAGFPFLQFKPISRNEADDRLLISYNSGQLIKNPLYFFGDETLETNLYGWMTMQFNAFYSDTEKFGVYLSTQDQNGYLKKMHFAADQQNHAMEYIVYTYAEDMLSEKKTCSNYNPSIVGLFEGDWYDAAQIYREWGVPTFAEDYPTSDNSRTPNWIKNLQLVMGFFTNNNWSAPIDAGKIVQGMLNNRDYFGLERDGLMAFWYNWNETGFATGYPNFMPPKENFRETVSRLKQNGIPVVASSCYFPWEKGRDSPLGTWSEAQEHCIQTEDGEPFTIERIAAEMRPYSNWWIKKFSGATKDLIETYGTSMSYVDTVGGAPGRLDFGLETEPVGHSGPVEYKGGGTQWTIGNQEFVRRLRAHGPVGMEASGDFLRKDGTIQATNRDLMHLDNMQFFPQSAKEKHNLLELVPLPESVYHDYGLYAGYGLLTTKGNNSRIFLSSNFMSAFNIIVAGDTPVLFTRNEEYDVSYPDFDAYGTYDPLNETQKLYFNKLLAAKNYAKKFLTFGRMLRQLDLRVTNTEVYFSAYTGDSLEYRINMPAVLNSVWEAPDGSIGLLLVNYTNSAEEVSYAIDLSGYGFAGTYSITEQDGEGTTSRGRHSGTYTNTETIPALSVRLVEFSH